MGKITFWGYRTPSVINEMYTIAELGIVSSKYEEFGYVALEMMSGLPVLLNNTTGLKELANAASINTYDGRIDSLTAHIKNSLPTPTTLDAINVMSKRLQQRYSSSLFKSRMTEMYSSLILSIKIIC